MEKKSPSKDIFNKPELQVYISEFGRRCPLWNMV